MARRRFSWLTFGLMVLLGGALAFCNRRADLVEPTAPVDSTGVKPPNVQTGVQILAMRIAGIPEEDITIDQTTLEISVKMPATVTNDLLKQTLTLTDDAELATNGAYILESWCSCCLSTTIKSQFGLRKKGSADGALKYYTVRPIPTGELAPAPLSAPLEYAIDSDNPLPVSFVNLYGNELPTSATLTREGSGQVISLSAKSGKITCAYLPSHLSLYLYDLPLTVGKYVVAFQWENGRTLNLSQPLVVRKGAPKLQPSSRFFGFSATQGMSLSLAGRYLLESETSVQLKSLDGQVVPFSAPVFQPDGTKLTLTIPKSTIPGVYLLQLLQDGQPAECHRLVVQESAETRLAISTITLASVSPLSDCSLTGPVVVEREKPTAIFVSWAPTPQTTAQLLLSNLADGSKSITVPIVTGQIEGSPKFTLPATLEPGRYEATVQLANAQTGQVLQSSAPFERVVNVR